MQTKTITLFLASITVLCSLSCSKMDATYADFIKEGKIIYPGKADSVYMFPGKNRLSLSWLLFDPNVTRTKIYWNNRADSLEVLADSSAGVDSIQVLLSDMAEGDYLFEYFTYDDDGNRSVKVEVPGHVYGDRYISALLPRPVQEAVFVPDTTKVYWGESADDGLIGMTLEYTDLRNQQHTVFADADETMTALPGLKPGTNFRYRTVFLPHDMAIDTFYTDYDTVAISLPSQPIALEKPTSTLGLMRIAAMINHRHPDYWVSRIRKPSVHVRFRYESSV